MKTYVIGAASNLSQRMKELIPNSELVSAREILASSKVEFSDTESFNVIINSFWPATRLREVSDPVSFISLSMLVTAKVLECLKNTSVNKVFYTSSASVYGDNKNCSEADDPKPKSLHASLKLANEQLVSSFCTEAAIPYSLIRVFNLYGGQDEFSIISKIITAQQNEAVLTVVNDGNSIRDFVHIDDVVAAYQALLDHNVSEKIINIASGKGRSVLSMLVHMRKSGYELNTQNLSRDEISLSVADVGILGKYYDIESMRDPREYIVEMLKDE